MKFTFSGQWKTDMETEQDLVANKKHLGGGGGGREGEGGGAGPMAIFPVAMLLFIKSALDI